MQRRAWLADTRCLPDLRQHKQLVQGLRVEDGREVPDPIRRVAVDQLPPLAGARLQRDDAARPLLLSQQVLACAAGWVGCEQVPASSAFTQAITCNGKRHLQPMTRDQSCNLLLGRQVLAWAAGREGRAGEGRKWE